MRALAILIFLFSFSAEAKQLGDALKVLPVQDGGRIKPYNTFAQETLQFIYGKNQFEVRRSGKEQSIKKDATEIVFTWMLVPEHWLDVAFVEVRHAGLKEALGLSKEEIQSKLYFTPKELLNNPRLALISQELNSKRETKEKLNPYFQAIQTLEDKLNLFRLIQSGLGMRVLPPPKNSESTTWRSIAELDNQAEIKFKNISNVFVAGVASELKDSEQDEEFNKNYDNLEKAVADFTAYAGQVNPELYAHQDKISLEIHLKDFHPFRWAWIIYILALVFALAAHFTRKDRYFTITKLVMLSGMVIHLYGIILRCILLERPPVGNMYETVVWVPFVGMIFAFWLEYRKRSGLLYIGSCLVSILCLVLSDLSPVVLDPSLHPLEPVLRDNFWLLVHVIIIVSSYAAFFLAFALGDIGLVYYFLGEKKYATQIKDGVLGIYRSIQIGVVMLAAGIITGGIWADYSWGRFWGWDPKETWALIALLGYVAVLHGRLYGWIRDFGMVVTGVVAFSLVIMAWYGVNFVLGAGLHTYGFGAGGVEYVSGFIAVHLLAVSYIITTRQSRMKNLKS